MKFDRLKLRAIAIAVIGIIAFTIVVATAVLAGINATTGTVDVALLTVAGGFIAGIAKPENKREEDKS